MPTYTLRPYGPGKIARIVDWFIRSDYFQSWQTERIESGAYAAPGSDDADRFGRCQDAAETGADGSTHAEVIKDMRAAFHDWLRDRERGRCVEHLRLRDAVDEYFDALETWHEQNGSLEEEIG